MRKKKWFAVYTRARYEKKVEKRLRESNITCYLPVKNQLRQWSDRKKWVEMPLFSSYIFVYVDDTEHDTVLKTVGAVRFVTFEGKAAQIPDKQIENIKWILSTNVETNLVEEDIPSGSKIEILKGPLMGLRAEMVNYKNKTRILVRITELDKSFEIHIPRSHVRVIS